MNFLSAFWQEHNSVLKDHRKIEQQEMARCEYRIEKN